MSSRRVPLSSNPNGANSPLRAAAGFGLAKQKRSHANIQREEPYGQPPPLKKQMLDNGRASKNPQVAQRTGVRAPVKDRGVQQAAASQKYAEGEEMHQWRKHHRAKFPKMVFYFESVPDETRVKVAKQVMSLGAREEKFFSIEITHVITTRAIPPVGRPEREDVREASHEDPEPDKQPQTINPSLLDRSSEARTRILLEQAQAARRLPAHTQEDVVKRAKPARNTDVLHKAREMGKKIWSLDKLQRMLQSLLDDGAYANAVVAPKAGTGRSFGGSFRSPAESLFQLLQNERVNGPSDRDPTVVNREIVPFKGPYIYVYDIDEKYKPIMVREYPKVANKSDGEWPQFRSVANGRCPFVEEIEEKENRKTKEKQKPKPADAFEAPALQPPEVPAPKPATGKRTLSQMDDGHNRLHNGIQPVEMFEPVKNVTAQHLNFQPQNAFTSKAGVGRLFAGEPVASGVQPSNVTSAIRSTMISSTSGINGAKAGTSKEIHGLQRKVLQKATPASHDASSRRLTEMSLDGPSSRSTTLGRTVSRQMDIIEEGAGSKDAREKQPGSAAQAQAPAPKAKRDLKPGYCENCQDKFRDFDEHILSRKHRGFAKSQDNWQELDSLLMQLKRVPKYGFLDEDEW